MNLRIKRCLSGLMIWAGLTGIAVAQPPNESEGTVQLGQPPAAVQTDPQGSEGTVRLGAPPQGLPPVDQAEQVNPGPGYFGITPVDQRFRTRFNVDSRGGGLYGTQGGYVTIGAFQPFQLDGDDAILFIDARGLVTYNNQGGGANVGLGWRWWDREYDRITGLSAWYDNSSGGIGANFNQIGLSFESLGRYMDYRINGYIPSGAHDHIGTSVLNNTASNLGNNIVFARQTQVAQAYTGFDIETGGPLPLLGRYGVNGFLGGYHFMGVGASGGSFTGVSGRWMAQINEDVSFGMQMTSDHTFGLNTQFQVFVTLPDGTPSRWMRNLSVQDRLTQSVYRQFRAITHTDAVNTFDLAINPATSKPYFVAFIDPNKTTPGTGTFENPFESVAQYNGLTAAQRAGYDVIVVSGLTSANNLVTQNHLDTGAGTGTPSLGLQLSNNQHLWGAGLTHTFTTPTGTFKFNTGSNASTPVLFNLEATGATGGRVVTVANNDEVSGMSILGTNPLGVQNSGIVSQAGGITNGFDINNNIFTSTLEAVQLTHSGSAVGLLTSNTVTGGPATGAAIGFQSVAGFDITQNLGTLSLLAQKNTITNVKGEDANGNGILDAGENINGNANPLPDLGIGMHFVATGVGSVINANDPANAIQPLGILGNIVTGSGAGIQLDALAGGKFNASVNGNALSNNTTGSTVLPTPGFGFAANAVGAGSVVTINSYTDNTTSSNEGDGTVLFAQNGGVLNVTGGILGPVAGGATTGDTFNSNQGDGLRLLADNGAIVMKSITSTGFGLNGKNGLDVVAMNGGQVTVTTALSGNTFTNNTLNGLLVSAQSGGQIGTLLLPFKVDSTALANTFTGNGTSAVLGDGLLFQTSTGSTIFTDVANVTATNNKSDGLGFILNGGAINVTNITSSTATGNGRDGMSLVNSNGGVFTTNFIGGLTAALGNTFSNNTRAGLFFGGVTPPTPLAFNNITQISNNHFDRTTLGTVGILFNTTNVVTSANPVAMTSTALTQNTFIGGSATTAQGIGGTVNGGGVLFALGDNQPSNANTFTTNSVADIGLILNGNSVNVFTIDNHNLSGVAKGVDPTFLGEGAAFVLQDTATLTGFIRRSTIATNAGDGIRFDVGGLAPAAQFASVNNFVIGGLAANLKNVIQSNGTNGIEVNRTSNGEVNNMQILNNTIQLNNQTGMLLSSANAANQDTYVISQNLITANLFSGIQLQVKADASQSSSITQNTITGNGTANNAVSGGSGIMTTEQFNSGDLRFITGTWTNNTITGNRFDGIDLTASMTTLVIGDPVDSTLGNTISSNLRNGVNVIGPGEVTIGSNLISLNGTVGTVGTANQTAGVMAQVNTYSNITVINNQIINNHGDGIEYNMRNGVGGATVDGNLQIIGSPFGGQNISFNDGRGVNILNRARSYIQVVMDGNNVNGNQWEGVYVVNTPSGAQNIFDPSTVALDQTGNPFFNPIIEMQFTNNQVSGNGNATSSFPSGKPDSTGLVVRVGTSLSRQSAFFAGGFASNGSISGGGSPFGSSTGLGGVTMVVDNNTFSGNFGNDVQFQSFTATAPTGTGTAWDPTAARPTFNTAGYQSDPLARLDLHFLGNTFDSQNFNNVAGVNTGNNLNAAFYNNADPLFKSRDSAQAAPGPFTAGGARDRNAQREAAFITPFNFPGPPSILYPGIGDSTFRLTVDSTAALIDTVDNNPTNGFLVDPVVPNTNAFTLPDQNGTSLPPTGNNGQRPYGWGSF